MAATPILSIPHLAVCLRVRPKGGSHVVVESACETGRTARTCYQIVLVSFRVLPQVPLLLPYCSVSRSSSSSCRGAFIMRLHDKPLNPPEALNISLCVDGIAGITASHWQTESTTDQSFFAHVLAANVTSPPVGADRPTVLISAE